MNVPFTAMSVNTITSSRDRRNIHDVLESGQYVMGPMLKQFEKELADYHGMKYAIGVGNGTDALWLVLSWPWGLARAMSASPPPIPSSPPPRPSGSPAPRPYSWTPTRTPIASILADRSGHHAADQGPGAGPSIRPVRRYEGHPQDRRPARSVRDRRQRAGHRRARRRLQHRRIERRGVHQLHHPEEPRHVLATAARWSPIARKWTA